MKNKNERQNIQGTILKNVYYQNELEHKKKQN